VEPVGEATIRPSARWLATKWPSTSTRSSTMPEVAPRLTTTSFIASASNTHWPSRITQACIRLRWSSSYSPASMGGSTVRYWSSGMSVMKPRRPWLMPIRGTPWRASCRPMPSMVPSPPTTRPRSHCAPMAATSRRGSR
jgi:hypothetical protein